MSSSGEFRKNNSASSKDTNNNLDTAVKIQKLDEEKDNEKGVEANYVIDKAGDIIKICKHILEKKKRRCKFNALRGLEYCVAHLAFNDQVIISQNVYLKNLNLLICQTK